MGETGLEIAVIGMSGKFPGAKNLDEFWDNLKNGRETLHFYTAEELQRGGVDPQLLENPLYVKAGGGILENIDYFDAGFFGYNPNEAMVMDPQMRIFHENAWEALEHAGYNPGTYNHQIGIYAGASSSFKWEARVSLSGKIDDLGLFAAVMLSSSRFLSTRVAYKLDLKGPGFNVQTACSTSLAAIVLACQGILTGQCNMALAGGVSVIASKGAAGTPPAGYIYKEGMLRSADGHCRAFDSKAGGTIAGEGVGVVLLKLLEEAIAHRDTIHAVIKGFAINNDGSRKPGYTAPSIEGQTEVIKAAHLVAETPSDTVTYIETHGTGTVLGDMVEIEALKQAFANGKKGICGIGSIKSNIGHLDAAAGVAGFIKTVLALKNQQLPPSLHFENPSPRSDLIASPFYVNARLTGWERNGHPLRAGVSSFGIGGTNAHVVLEESPQFSGQRTADREQGQLILLSAITSTALDTMKQNLAAYLRKNPGINLADAAYTLQVGRKSFPHRWMAICSHMNETIAALTAPQQGETRVTLPGTPVGNPLQEKTGPASTADKESLTRIGRLWLHGRPIAWPDFYAKEKRARIPLPTYPFERQRYWIEESGIQPGPAIKDALARGNRLYLENPAEWVYLPNWKRSVPPSHNHAPGTNKTYKWLVLADAFNLGTLIVNHLQNLGQEVVTVTPGTALAHPDRQQYTINPRQPADYRELLAEVASAPSSPGAPGQTLFHILHLWTLTGDKVDQTGSEELQSLGFYSLLHLAKAIKQTTADTVQQFRLTVISDHWQDVTGQETLEPAKSTMLGALAVIPQEYPNIRCRSLDIVLPDPGSPQQQDLVNRLLTEITNNPNPEQAPNIAYRGPYRLVQEFQPLHLETPIPNQLPLRQKGVYLITGGLGRIGFNLAGYLAGEFKARLVLTGRSARPGTAKTAELEALGGEVMICTCDMADEEKMREIIARAEQRWGQIHGVIHAAGLIGESAFAFIDQLDVDLCQRHFQAKIHGTLVLEKIFRHKPLDFCWLMSSISTVLGGLRFSAYAAANSFMDAFACRMKRSHPVPWLSVDWDGMPKEQTIDIFKRILTLVPANIPRLAVSRESHLQQRIDQWIKLESLQEKTSPPKNKNSALHPRPQLLTPYVAPDNEIQKSLAGIWQKIFGYEQIGSRDDFLELGGDSLKAITLVSMIQNSLEVRVPLTELFRLQTIEKLDRFIRQAEKEKAGNIQPIEKQGYYELSFHQQRLWIIFHKEPGTSAYNIPAVITLTRHVDTAILKESLDRLAARHESLRTGIKPEAGRAIQFIKEKVTVPYRELDISHLEAGEIQQQRKKIRSAEILAPFDLANPPLFRVLLLKWGKNARDLVFSVHHMISDGWSQEILKRDLMLCYQALQAKKNIPRQPLPLSYKDFTAWQHKQILHPGIKEKSHQYWKQKLTGGLAPVELPVDYPDSRQDIAGAGYYWMINAALKDRIKQTAKQHNTTLFMVMFSTFILLLADLTRQEDITCSIIEAGREEVAFQQVMGFFVNSIPFKTRVETGAAFSGFLSRLNREVLEAFQHGSYPVEYVFEELGMKYPRLSTSFNMLNMQQLTGEIPLHPYEPVHVPQTQDAKFDIEPYITEYSSGIDLKWVYRKRVFDPGTISHIAAAYLKTCEYFVHNPGKSLQDFRRTGKGRQFKKSDPLFLPGENPGNNHPKGRFTKEK